MPLFNTPVPLAPGPKAKPSAMREGDTIKALGETRGVLARLVSMLSGYQPNFLTDAKGRRFEVLARDIGKGVAPIFGSKPFELVKVDATTLRVMASTVFNQSPSLSATLTPSASGFVWVEIPFTESTGAIGTATLENGATITTATSSLIVVPIGEWTFDAGAIVDFPQNYRYGPVTGEACQDFYANPANWTLTVF